MKWQNYINSPKTSKIDSITIKLIGLGISTIVLKDLVISEVFDKICDCIEEKGGEDVVQSVDIDWDTSVPVRDIMWCLSKLGNGIQARSVFDVCKLFGKHELFVGLNFIGGSKANPQSFI